MSSFDDPTFQGLYPVSFVLRNTCPDIWFRIHSLPESKRYPETELEWKTLIDRHRQFSNALLEEGSPCRIHYTLFSDEGISKDILPHLDWSDPIQSVPEYDQSIFTQTANITWDFERFSPWIKRCSEGEFGWISIHSLTTDAIYAPYDGGADLFSTNFSFLDKLRDKFMKWKSPHPEGL